MSSNCVVFFVFLASFKFCGHVTQCSALLFITTNILYGFLCAVFPAVMVQLHQFFLLDGTGMVAKLRGETCSPHPHYLSNPSSHNEANMSNPIIIPCLFNNSGALSRIFFSPLSTHPRWGFLIFSTLQSSTSWVSFSARGSCLRLVM